MDVDVQVVEHKKTEVADKAPHFTVTFKGLIIDTGYAVKLAIKGDKETLFDSYPLKSQHAIKLSSPQTKLR